MNEDEQANYLVWRNKEAWRLASDVSKFLFKNFADDEREAAWHQWRDLMARHVREHEHNAACEQCDTGTKH